jgi:cell division protein FtsI/penicillin-binding protein 2
VTGFALAAAIVMIEAGSGRVLRQEGEVTRRVAPGSTIKPFVLRATDLRPERVCGRKLTLNGRRMDCVHPLLATPVTAREALTYSCNYYFAKLAESIEPEKLAATLRQFGFVLSRSPQTAQDRQLVALGEFGVTTTPLDLARAYARLGSEPGLREAVEAGTAQQAAVAGLAVAGKTGTTRGFAWFAGYAPADKPQVAVVVLVNEGTGGNAAAPEAAKVLKQWFARR